MSPHLPLQLALLVLLANPAPASASEDGGPRRLVLDGTWDFQIDPHKQGETKQWWSAQADYSHQIQVPGTWQAHGFGEPKDIARHNYQGVAWYRRSFTIPADWSGRRIWLRFEGVVNHGDVFVNGQKIGLVETFITPYEFDVTDQIAVGKDNMLVCRVDSAALWPPPPGYEAANHSAAVFLGSYVGMMQYLVHAGGINSHVILEARSDPRIDRVVIVPDIHNKTAQVDVRLTRHDASKPREGRVAVRIRPVKEPADDVGGEASASFDASAESCEATVILALAGLRPWSPEDPFLYDVETLLFDGEQLMDRRVVRTGLRQLTTTPEGNFLLNGKPYYLRGVGYDSLEPITGVPVPDKETYVQRLRLLKQYGFNYIRLLAHTPLDELFEAADEVGMFLQTEGEWFLGPNPMPEPTGDLFARQIPKMIREFGHHPSWYAFSCFNEATNADSDPVKRRYVESTYRTFREMDPTRFFIASDGPDQWPTDIITDHLGGAMSKADLPIAEPLAAAPIEVFQGHIDELAVYPKALSIDTMRRLACSLPQASPRPPTRRVRPTRGSVASPSCTASAPRSTTTCTCTPA